MNVNQKLGIAGRPWSDRYVACPDINLGRLVGLKFWSYLSGRAVFLALSSAITHAVTLRNAHKKEEIAHLCFESIVREA